MMHNQTHIQEHYYVFFLRKLVGNVREKKLSNT
jgi:hypothetical protein